MDVHGRLRRRRAADRRPGAHRRRHRRLRERRRQGARARVPATRAAPYRFDAVDVEARAVYTNNPPCGAMRGFGVNQVVFAIDGMLDRLAERVGIDPWEMRWRNALEVGDRFGTGQVLGEGVGIKACLEAVRDAYRGARYAGIGCGVKNTGIGNGLIEYGRAILRPEADGTVTLFHSWTEMGQGVNTVLAQIACEELGVTVRARARRRRHDARARHRTDDRLAFHGARRPRDHRGREAPEGAS